MSAPCDSPPPEDAGDAAGSDPVETVPLVVAVGVACVLTVRPSDGGLIGVGRFAVWMVRKLMAHRGEGLTWYGLVIAKVNLRAGGPAIAVQVLVVVLPA